MTKSTQQPTGDAGEALELSASPGKMASVSRRSLLRIGLATGGAVGIASLAACTSTAADAPVATTGDGNTDAAGLYASVGILTTASYWIGPKAAMKSAEQKFGLTTSFNGTTGLDDAELVTILDQLIPQNPKGFLIEPADPTAVQDVIKRARDAGIPSLIINSGYLPEGNEVGYIGFSRQEAAALAADVIIEQAPAGPGKVVCMIFSASAQAMTDGLAGFKAQIAKKRPELEVITVVDNADNQYATTLMEQTLNANPDIVGVASIDTVGGQSAANAMKTLGKEDIVLVAGGLDEGQAQYWPLIESGIVNAGILSSSFEQFYVGLQFLVNLNTNAINGIDWRKNKEVRVVPKNTDLGSFVVTKDNVGAFKNLG